MGTLIMTGEQPASALSLLRQANSMLRLMPRSRATAVTVIPGENVAATAASFSPRAQRRRGAPSIRSMYHRPSADSLGPCLKTSPYPPIIRKARKLAMRSPQMIATCVMELHNDRLSNHQVQARTEKVGRNDPCPCGSGKKYKKCCLQTEKQ